MVLAKEKNKKPKGKTSKKSDFRITLYYGWSYSRRFGYGSMKAIFSKDHCAAPERKKVYNAGIEIPCNYELFGPKIHKKFVRDKIKNSGCLSLYSFLTLSSI